MDERLRKFAVLVDAGSYTKAAQELHVSQPALSTAINKLERELKAELIVHGSRKLQLTKAGRLAYDSAKELSVLSSNLSVRIAELLKTNPEFTVGMIDSVANILFASKAAVDEFDSRSKLAITVNNSRYLVSAVARDEVDVAFITDKPKNNIGKYVLEHVADEPLVLVCGREIAVKVDESLKSGKLPEFISYDHASATQKIVKSELEKLGIKITSVYTSNSPAVALQLVLLQKGVAVLPYVLVKYYVDNGQLILIGNEEPLIIERPINMIKRRGKVPLTTATKMAARLGQLIEAYRAELTKRSE